MDLREFFLENLAADLEYHPRRGALYLGLGVACLCVWMFAPSGPGYTVVRLVFGVGSLGLLLKGAFLLRKASEGLGLSELELAQLSDPSTRKTLPPMPTVAAQIIQDFGTGVFLLGPVLHLATNVNEAWRGLPGLLVTLIGAGLFLVGWLVRRLTSPGPLAG
jgi:hypothetical protein